MALLGRYRTIFIANGGLLSVPFFRSAQLLQLSLESELMLNNFATSFGDAVKRAES